jgi:hypothetical protein
MSDQNRLTDRAMAARVESDHCWSKDGPAKNYKRYEQSVEHLEAIEKLLPVDPSASIPPEKAVKIASHVEAGQCSIHIWQL